LATYLATTASFRRQQQRRRRHLNIITVFTRRYFKVKRSHKKDFCDVCRRLTFTYSNFTAMSFDCSIRIQVVKSMINKLIKHTCS